MMNPPGNSRAEKLLDSRTPGRRNYWLSERCGRETIGYPNAGKRHFFLFLFCGVTEKGKNVSSQLVLDKFLLFLLIILTIFFFYNFYIFHLHFPGINNLCDLLYSYGLQIQAEILQNIRLTAVLWKSGKQNPGIHINSSGCLRQNIYTSVRFQPCICKLAYTQAYRHAPGSRHTHSFIKFIQ